jgi:flavin-dependent dehydrogenase
LTVSALAAPLYQVAVLGGGTAGCATALALRRRGIPDVLLVEAGDYAHVRVGESIPPECRLLLDRLGIWQDFLAEGHEPCLGSCSVWGDDAPGYNDFLLNPHGTGWHLDRRRFDAFLARKAVEAGVELCDRTRCDAVEPCGEDGFTLRLTAAGGPRTVSARFVVDAAGSRSRLARSLGAARQLHDRLCYVAAFLEIPGSAALSRLTLLEAVESGWWYAARLPERRVAVAVASDPEIVRNGALHRKDVWLTRLRETRHLWDELAGCAPTPESLIVRTALSFRLDHVCGPGWLAVGDAASSYDPIASQGIYKALLDGLEAAEAIAAWLGGAPGALDALGEYDAAIAERFEDYLANRNYFYARERRWPAAPFWARRRARATATSSRLPSSY